MLDLRLIRENPEFVKAEIAKLYATAPIDEAGSSPAIAMVRSTCTNPIAAPESAAKSAASVATTGSRDGGV